MITIANFCSITESKQANCRNCDRYTLSMWLRQGECQSETLWRLQSHRIPSRARGGPTFREVEVEVQWRRAFHDCPQSEGRNRATNRGPTHGTLALTRVHEACDKKVTEILILKADLATTSSSSCQTGPTCPPEKVLDGGILERDLTNQQRHTKSNYKCFFKCKILPYLHHYPLLINFYKKIFNK